MESHGFAHRKGGHCGSSALRDLLEHHGLTYGTEPISEGMVFGLAGALAFAFAEDVAPFFDNPDISLPLYLNGRSEDLEQTLCGHLGVRLDLRRSDDPADGWRWLRDELDAARPTMVWANMKDLSYQRVRLDNARHDIVVVAYDGERGEAIVADHDFDDLQRCSLESLARARSANAFPGSPRHATWVMRFPKRLPDLSDAVESALRKTIATMRCEELLAWEVTDGATASQQPYRQGLRGTRAFTDSFASWPERFGDDLAASLRLLYVLVERAGTGGGFYRAFQARFLEESAELLDDPALRRAADTYRELADTWRRVARSARSRPAPAAHAAALREVWRACELEERGVERLEAWVDERAGVAA
jgi:hypothetical protein